MKPSLSFPKVPTWFLGVLVGTLLFGAMSHMSVTVVTSQMDRKGRQHWVLKVGYRGREYGLRKRFSEMARLSNHLNSTVLKGLVLPSAFPEKNYPWSSSKRDEDVLRRRQMGIQAWFDQLISMGVCVSLLKEFLLVDEFQLLSLRQEAELNGLVVMSKQQLALDSCKQNMLPLAARPLIAPSGSPRELGRPPLASRTTSSSSSSRHISVGSGTTPPASLSSSPSSSFSSSFGIFGRMRGAGDRSRGGSVADDSGAAGIAAVSSQPRQSSTLSLALAASLPSSGAPSSAAPPRSQSTGVNVSNGSISTGYRAQALSSGSYTQSSSLSSLSHALAAAAGSSRGPSPAATSSACSSYSRSIGGSFSGSRSFSGAGGAFLDIHMMGAADLQSTMLSDAFGQHITRLWKQHGEDTMELLERICCSTLPVAAAEVDELAVPARTRGERAALDDFSPGVLEDDILGLESVFGTGSGNSEGAGVVGVLDAPLVFLSSDLAEVLTASLRTVLPSSEEKSFLVAPVPAPPLQTAAPESPSLPLPSFPPHNLRPPLDSNIGSIPLIPRRTRDVFFFPR